MRRDRTGNGKQEHGEFSQLTPAQLKADKGLNFKPPQTARNPHLRTFRVDDNFRVVVYAPDGGGTLLLLKVLPHDDAYDWARKHDAAANPVTGGLEIWDAETLERVTPAMEQQSTGTDERFFDFVSDGDLRTLGLDDKTLRAARSVVDAAQLEVFVPVLPEDQAEVLQFLAQGFGVEEVWRDLVAHRAPAPASTSAAGDETAAIEAAIRNTPTRIALVSGGEVLADILERPFAEWRVFLHPSQRRVAYKPSFPGTLAGFRSSLQGEVPTAVGAADQDAEIAAVVRRVRAWADTGIDPADIAVTVRFNAAAKKLKEALKAEGLTAVLLSSDPKPETEGVRVGTWYALKGLEFRCVAVAGVCDWALPFAKAVTPEDVDPIQHATDMMSERCLLFVACTRARDRLHVSWHGEPSGFLTEAGIA